MKILAICTVYNEIDYIKYKAAWCLANGLELYAIDNMSTDGTWEWLQANGIKSHRFDTDGEFHLIKLQAEMTKTIHQEQPDWVIYHGADLFFCSGTHLGDIIKQADHSNYNSIAMPYFQVCNTGEERGSFPFSTYFYGSMGKVYSFIAKYHPQMTLVGDTAQIPYVRELKINGILLNYGHTKEKHRREETVARRQKAWDNGLPSNLGRHYNRAPVEWQWAKEKLSDIRTTPYYPYVQKMRLQIIEALISY